MAHTTDDEDAMEPGSGIDVLLVSPGSTPGLRLADRQLESMLVEAGATVTSCDVDPGARRFGDPFDDLLESRSARRALRSATGRHRPRSLIFSTPTSALLAQVGELPHAIWFDQPAPSHLHGARNVLIRALERGAFAGADLLMPYSPQAMQDVRDPRARSVVVPTPVAESRPRGTPGRAPLVVTYAAGPWEKGLDLMCEAWSTASPHAQARLVVTGIDAHEARTFLRRRRVRVDGATVEFTGTLSQPDFLDLLGRAHVFLTGSRSEGFGQAALQALDAGAGLVGAPGRGPFPGLALARELNPSFVARDRTPAALAAALTCALACAEAEMADYRARARALLRPYRREVIVASLRTAVLPVLLGDRDVAP